jgi:hypothetical protein
MKNILFWASILLFSFSTFGQKSNPSNPVLFLGLDFSNARLVGPQGFSNPQAIKDYYFNVWNQMFLNEKSKYNIASYFKKSIEYNFSAVSEINQGVSLDELITNNTYNLKESDIASSVKKYNIPQNNCDLGLVFIVESLNKNSEFASIYVTYFDVKNRKVLVTTRLEGKPKGFGFRNYWMGAIKNLLEKVPSNRKNWEPYLQIK